MTAPGSDGARGTDRAEGRPAFDAGAYWDERLRTHGGLTGVGYASLPESFNRWMYRVRRRVFDRVLDGLDVDPGSARVLDIGSGTGFYLERWDAAGAAEIEAMDISATAVARLRSRFPDVTVHHGDIGNPEAVAGLEGRFDIVSAMDVVFHIVDDAAFDRAVRGIAAVLRDGGLLLFSDNFIRGTERRLPHVVHRRLEDVRAVLQRAGLEVVERRPMFVLMNAPVDSTSRTADARWSALVRTARAGELAGWLVGALLYPVELVLTRVLRESPTTELMVCRRRNSSAIGPRDAP